MMTEFEKWYQNNIHNGNKTLDDSYGVELAKKAWNAALNEAKQQYPNSHYEYSDYVERRLKHNINSLYE